MNRKYTGWNWMILIAVTLVPGMPGRAAMPIENAVLTYAPQVPPAIQRKKPAVVRVEIVSEEKEGVLMDGFEKGTIYRYWTFNGHVPGPFVRARVGDILEVHLKNPEKSTMPHNIDFHAVTGPGGGAPVLTAAPGEEKTARFKLLNPGFFVYHCAAPPVVDHIANGMYGVVLVEPEKGLSRVDREFYVMESEFYTKQPFGTEGLVDYSHEKAVQETPTYIVFNGRVNSMMGEGELKVKKGESVRIFFGNGGPGKIGSFHVIGEIFDNVYREGSVTRPEHNIQTTLVPPGSASIVEFSTEVPGNYTIVDHAIGRLELGAVGILNVEGADSPLIYQGL